MSDTAEKMRQELQTAQRELAEAQARCERHDAEHQVATKELEENRSALLFMLEDLEAGRRKIEQAHQEWMAALDVVDDPIFLHDKQFRLLRCNKAYQQRAGIPFHELIGRLYYEIFPKAAAPLPCCLRAMEKAEEEVLVGGAIYRSRAFSIKDEQDVYLYSVHTLEDITEKHKVDARLQLFHELLDQSSDGISIADSASSRFLYVNQAICHDLGYTREELLQRGVIDIQTELPDTAAWQAHVQRLRAKDFAILESEALRKDGSRFPVENNLRNITTADGDYIVAVVRNITERKRAETVLYESEEKFRKISESAQDAIIMMGADQCISFWNAAAERIFGYTAAEAMGQELHALIVPPPAHTKFTQAFPHFQETGDGPVIGKVIEVIALRKGGEEFPVELSVSATQFSRQWHAIGIVRDITERKRAEEQLRLRAQLLDSTADSIFVSDSDGNFVYLNEAAWKSRGYTRDELMGMNLHQLDTPEYGKLIETRIRELVEKGHCIFESAHHRKDGSIMPVEVSARIIKSGDSKLVLAAARDITERKQAEQALYESEKLYRSLFENMLNGFAYCRMIFEDDQPQDFVYLSVNAAFETLTGLKNVAGKRVSEVIPGIRQSDPRLFEIYGRVSLSGKPERFEIYVEGLQQWFWISVYSPGKGYFVAVFDVITERKKAEQTLKKSEALLGEMGRMAKMGGWEFDAQTGEGTWTDEVARIHDMDPAEATSFEIGIGFYRGESRQKIEAAIKAAIADGIPYDLELEMVTAKGNHKWVRTIAQPVKKGGKVVRVGGSFQDITESKQAEIAIQHTNRALATLSAVNRSLVYATDENELLQAICQVIVEQRGYRIAWVGYVQHDESKSIKIMARAGHDEGYLDAMQLTWAETERGMGGSGRAIRSGATQLCQDIASDPLYLPWRDAALERGYAANIALPLLRGDNAVFGVLNVYAGEANAFTLNEIALLEEMAGDLAFGVRSLRLRQERDLALVKNKEHLVQLAFQNEEKEKRAAELIIANKELAFQNEEKEKRAAELIIANKELQDSMEGTVRAIATIVEMRDPYTAGHQVRVADLAATIAKQMGLPDEQAHAIHLAGTVHDLGKIQIPAEILSKPGKITDIEFSLIKIHPRAGYDILKDINFPWPIAQMVLQHHERLDGSGYPQGLSGDAILLEARILSVADVVEAMSSHRPYRPGLGIEVALAEITKQRGMYYDSRVVDACVSLFRERGYKLPG